MVEGLYVCPWFMFPGLHYKWCPVSEGSAVRSYTRVCVGSVCPCCTSTPVLHCLRAQGSGKRTLVSLATPPLPLYTAGHRTCRYTWALRPSLHVSWSLRDETLNCPALGHRQRTLGNTSVPRTRTRQGLVPRRPIPGWGGVEGPKGCEGTSDRKMTGAGEVSWGRERSRDRKEGRGPQGG